MIGVHDVRTAPRSPWQYAYVERFIGSVRRECLDHVIILNAVGLRRILRKYVEHCTTTRAHSARHRDPLHSSGKPRDDAAPEK
jgi:hypothetical protein